MESHFYVYNSNSIKMRAVNTRKVGRYGRQVDRDSSTSKRIATSYPATRMSDQRKRPDMSDDNAPQKSPDEVPEYCQYGSPDCTREPEKMVQYRDPTEFIYYCREHGYRAYRNYDKATSIHNVDS